MAKVLRAPCMQRQTCLMNTTPCATLLTGRRGPTELRRLHCAAAAPTDSQDLVRSTPRKGCACAPGVHLGSLHRPLSPCVGSRLQRPQNPMIEVFRSRVAPASPLRPTEAARFPETPGRWHQDFCPGAGEAAAAPDCRAPVRFMVRKGCAAAAATSRRSACLYARHLHAARLLSPQWYALVDALTDALPGLRMMSPWKGDSSCCVRLMVARSVWSVAILQRLASWLHRLSSACRCA